MDKHYYISKDGHGFLNLKSPLNDENYTEVTEEEFNNAVEAVTPKYSEPVVSDQQKYEDRVVELIRQKYSLSQELAILRQRDTKPEEFAEYNSYVEECKATAKTEILGG